MGAFLQCHISKSRELCFTPPGSLQSLWGDFPQHIPARAATKPFKAQLWAAYHPQAQQSQKVSLLLIFFLPKSAPDSLGLEQANELVIITPASSVQPQGPTIINDLDWNLGLTATFPKAHSSSQLPGKSSGLQWTANVGSEICKPPHNEIISIFQMKGKSNNSRKQHRASETEISRETMLMNSWEMGLMN